MTGNSRTVAEGDSYVTKIVKYVPAESIALTTGFFAAFSPHGWTMVLALTAFAAANFGYLYGTAHVNDDRKDTPPHFYLLATLAFLLWAFATINAVAAWANLTGEAGDPQRAWILGLSTTVIPMLDSAVKATWPEKWSLSPTVRKRVAPARGGEMEAGADAHP